MKRSDTKTQILNVAQGLIQERGVNGMSFKDISEIIGIRRASIHHHFETKEKLLEVLITRYSQQYGGTATEIVESDASAKQKLMRYMKLFLKTAEADPPDKACLCGMMAAEIDSIGAEAAQLVVDYSESSVQKIANILRQGQEEGDFQFNGDVNAMARMIFSFLEGGLIFVKANGQKKQFKAMTDQVLKLIET